MAVSIDDVIKIDNETGKIKFQHLLKKFSGKNTTLIASISTSKTKPQLPRSNPPVTNPLQALNKAIDTLNNRIKTNPKTPNDPAPAEYTARLNGIQKCTDSKTLEEFYRSNIQEIRNNLMGKGGFCTGLLKNTNIAESHRRRLQRTIDDVTGYSAYQTKRKALLQQEAATAATNAHPKMASPVLLSKQLDPRACWATVGNNISLVPAAASTRRSKRGPTS